MAESTEVRGITWRQKETMTRIQLWSDEKVPLELNSSRNNSTVFETYPAKEEKAGYARNTQQCMSKIKTLTTKYHEAKKNKTSGSGRDNLIYFEQMNQVLQDEPSSCPAFSIDKSRDEVIFSVESIHSILLTGVDGAAGGQILSPRLFITQ